MFQIRTFRILECYFVYLYILCGLLILGEGKYQGREGLKSLDMYLGYFTFGLCETSHTCSGFSEGVACVITCSFEISALFTGILFLYSKCKLLLCLHASGEQRNQ